MLEITDKELQEIFEPFISNIKLRKPEVVEEFDLRYLLRHLINNIDPAVTQPEILKTVMNNLLIFHTSNYLLNHCHLNSFSVRTGNEMAIINAARKLIASERFCICSGFFITFKKCYNFSSSYIINF